MPDTIHATTVAIGGRGVLISGPSGSGKSDLALRLIDRGAVLVADGNRARAEQVLEACLAAGLQARHVVTGPEALEVALADVPALVIAALELPLIDALVTVSDAPPKPHPAGYAAICAALKVEPARAVMVGDHWANDVAGAASAGLNAVWYAPADLQAPESSVPHRRLSSYEPLADALRVILG